jgi:ABC-type transporter Mla MlaB component
MLRIQTKDSAERITLALQGDLTGVWVCEFLHAWREANRALNGRNLAVDLSDVGRVDNAAEYLLALVRCSGTMLTGRGVVIGFLLETIAANWPAAPNNPEGK